MRLFFVSLLLTLTFSTQTIAAEVKEMIVSGVVKAERKFAATCMAIGCPPSKSYVALSLEVTDGDSAVETIALGSIDLTGFAGVRFPQTIELAGVDVSHGDEIILYGEVKVYPGNFASLVEAYEVEVTKHARPNRSQLRK